MSYLRSGMQSCIRPTVYRNFLCICILCSVFFSVSYIQYMFSPRKTNLCNDFRVVGRGMVFVAKTGSIFHGGVEWSPEPHPHWARHQPHLDLRRHSVQSSRLQPCLWGYLPEKSIRGNIALIIQHQTELTLESLYQQIPRIWGILKHKLF